MTKEEMLRLQGIHPDTLNISVSEKSLGQQIGNGMSLNVIERILRQALLAARLVDAENLADRWADGSALEDLQKPKTVPNPGIDVPERRFIARILSSAKFDRYSHRSLIIDSGASYPVSYTHQTLPTICNV